MKKINFNRLKFFGLKNKKIQFVFYRIFGLFFTFFIFLFFFIHSNNELVLIINKFIDDWDLRTIIFYVIVCVFFIYFFYFIFYIKNKIQFIIFFIFRYINFICNLNIILYFFDITWEEFIMCNIFNMYIFYIYFFGYWFLKFFLYFFFKKDLDYLGNLKYFYFLNLPIFLYILLYFFLFLYKFIGTKRLYTFIINYKEFLEKYKIFYFLSESENSNLKRNLDELQNISSSVELNFKNLK